MPRRNHPTHRPKDRIRGHHDDQHGADADRDYRLALARARRARAVVNQTFLNRLRPGDIVAARVQFREVSDYKIRPCVVVRVDATGAVVAHPCTSQTRHSTRPGYVPLNRRAIQGLPRPTLVRATEQLELAPEDIVEVLGSVDRCTLQRIRDGA